MSSTYLLCKVASPHGKNEIKTMRPFYPLVCSLDLKTKSALMPLVLLIIPLLLLVMPLFLLVKSVSLSIVWHH